MSSVTLGRASENELEDGVIQDSPSRVLAAVLANQDKIIEKLNAILAVTDGAADGDALNTALQGVDLTSLSKVKLYR